MTADDTVSDETHTVTTDKLIEIWLGGFVSGASSACINFGHMDEDRARRFAYTAQLAATGDPMAMEVIRDQISEALAGQIAAATGIVAHGLRGDHR